MRFLTDHTKSAILLFACLVVFSGNASASPTMIRLGYARCGACHLAPLGAGLLTDYGKGIDDAQSLRRKEYQPPDPTQSPWFRYDGRFLASGYATTANDAGGRPTPPAWLRSYFRTSTALGARHRIAATAYLESPAGDIERFLDSRPTVDVLAAYEYEPSDVVTLAVARDRLPRGVELGETRTILQSTDDERFPTQVRAYVGNERVLVTGYGYGPGSETAWTREAYGAGALGEVQFFGNHVVVGASARREFRHTFDSNTWGAYARLGFGSWGILAEHEYSDRWSEADGLLMTDRYLGYTQLFVAAREWLVTSVIAEQARDTTASHVWAIRWRPEVQARLSSNFTITASVRTDWRRGTAGAARIYLIQAAIKTVQ